MERFYPIGTPGVPWTQTERDAWWSQREIVRSYAQEVLQRIEGLGPGFRVQQYGALSIEPQRYPLYAVMPATPVSAPWALVTGGVHGYETSGVQGALDCIEQLSATFQGRVNLVVAPCVSPWGYEVINRWNPYAVDPNRSFVANSESEEAAALMRFVAELDVSFAVHMDLHETTDSDEQEFRPALAARDGTPFEPGVIPDGFYTVADSENPQPEFQAAIIAAVEAVTHIAPPDANGQIIGADVTQPGVIHYPFKALGLCAGLTDARFTTTTEVYPDSPRATDAICNAAQVAAVRGGLQCALQLL
ncbi:MAG: M14 family metallocarboxypeptidase [Nannocystaceae bacterium]|nr:M14 family metallocarboxypeptidase [bacterium]